MRKQGEDTTEGTRNPSLKGKHGNDSGRVRRVTKGQKDCTDVRREAGEQREEALASSVQGDAPLAPARTDVQVMLDSDSGALPAPETQSVGQTINSCILLSSHVTVGLSACGDGSTIEFTDSDLKSPFGSTVRQPVITGWMSSDDSSNQRCKRKVIEAQQRKARHKATPPEGDEQRELKIGRSGKPTKHSEGIEVTTPRSEGEADLQQVTSHRTGVEASGRATVRDGHRGEPQGHRKCEDYSIRSEAPWLRSSVPLLLGHGLHSNPPWRVRGGNSNPHIYGKGKKKLQTDPAGKGDVASQRYGWVRGSETAFQKRNIKQVSEQGLQAERSHYWSMDFSVEPRRPRSRSQVKGQRAEAEHREDSSESQHQVGRDAVEMLTRSHSRSQVKGQKAEGGHRVEPS
eukprot:1683395-Amphidinium_carterae.1